jgi:hypothetical protein
MSDHFCSTHPYDKILGRRGTEEIAPLSPKSAKAYQKLIKTRQAMLVTARALPVEATDPNFSYPTAKTMIRKFARGLKIISGWGATLTSKVAG